jgi:flagellar basal-body rod modification protein FlgD
MQNQDPLNPSTDTDYIAQLATFSQLEQLQNLSSATTNSQAYSLVGKTVIVKTDDSNYVTGKVDYVYTSGTTTKLSINGTMYNSTQLDTVYSDDYVTEQNSPKVDTTKLSYDAANPKDLNFTVNLGTGDTVADDVAVAINGTVIDSSLVDVSGTKVTVKASAFDNLENGSYKVTLVFNDSLYTTVKDKVTLDVKNAVVDTSDDSTQTDDGSTQTAESTTT